MFSQNVPSVCHASSKSVEMHLGLPEKPKKPLTPFFRFLKEIQPELKANNPTVPQKDIIKLTGEQWAKVDPNKKKILEAEYKKDQMAYLSKHAAYENKLTDEQKDQIKNFKAGLIELKEKRQLRKKIQELGKPKKPPSAFLHFLNDERKRNPHKNGLFLEWQRETAEKWKKLSEAEQEQYNKLHKTESQKYR